MAAGYDPSFSKKYASATAVSATACTTQCFLTAIQIQPNGGVPYAIVYDGKSTSGTEKWRIQMPNTAGGSQGMTFASPICFETALFIKASSATVYLAWQGAKS